eukprot:7379782-Prymnesium_polylepis.1
MRRLRFRFGSAADGMRARRCVRLLSNGARCLAVCMRACTSMCLCAYFVLSRDAIIRLVAARCVAVPGGRGR